MSIATVDADAKTHVRRWTAEESVAANTLDGTIAGDEGVSLSRDGKTNCYRVRAQDDNGVHVMRMLISATHQHHAQTSAHIHRNNTNI